MSIISLIRIAIVILFSACAVAFIGIYSENKVSELYDEIEIIKKNKKLVKMWQLGFTITYTDAISSKLYDDDAYIVEQDTFKEINRCVRNWQIAKRSGILEWAIPDYMKFSVQEFYEPREFNKIKNTHNNFLDWEKKNNSKNPCLEKNSRIYLDKTSTELISFYPYFLTNLNKILTVHYKQENSLYEEIEKESEKASNLYLATFLILILSTFLIVFIDVKSNRGNSE